MDKKQALSVLIKHTFLFSEEVKVKLLGKINTLSDGDIDKLGKFLALEKKQSIEENSKIISELDTLLQKLEN